MGSRESLCYATGSSQIRHGVRWQNQIFAILVSISLVACATAPRGPADTLANAGVTSANALTRDYRLTASRIREVAVLDAFSNTLGVCSNPNTCVSIPPPVSLRLEREQLAHAIEFRGRAAEALANAYAALKVEADYDGRADLVSATSTAIDSDANGAAAEDAYRTAKQAQKEIDDDYKAARAIAEKIRLVGGIVSSAGDLLRKAGKTVA